MRIVLGLMLAVIVVVALPVLTALILWWLDKGLRRWFWRGRLSLQG